MRFLGRDSNQNKAKTEPKPKRHLLLSSRVCGSRAPSQSACPVISGLWSSSVVRSPCRIVELMRVTSVLSHLDRSIIILKQWLSEWILKNSTLILGFPAASDGKVSPCNVRDQGSIPGSGRSPGEGNGNPLQYSCLENPMHRGAWWATGHRVTKSLTRLSDFTFLPS